MFELVECLCSVPGGALDAKICGEIIRLENIVNVLREVAFVNIEIRVEIIMLTKVKEWNIGYHLVLGKILKISVINQAEDLILHLSMSDDLVAVCVEQSRKSVAFVVSELSSIPLVSNCGHLVSFVVLDVRPCVLFKFLGSKLILNSFS